MVGIALSSSTSASLATKFLDVEAPVLFSRGILSGSSSNLLGLGRFLDALMTSQTIIDAKTAAATALPALIPATAPQSRFWHDAVCTAVLFVGAGLPVLGSGDEVCGTFVVTVFVIAVLVLAVLVVTVLVTVVLGMAVGVIVAL